MTKQELINAAITFGLISLAFYLGNRWGSSKTIEVYGGVMSAEALVYLASMDSED